MRVYPADSSYIYDVSRHSIRTMPSGPFTISETHLRPGAANCTNAVHQDVAPLSEEQALTWFVALNRASVTDQERMAFNRWLALDPVNRRSYEAVLALWQRLDLQSPPAAAGPRH